MMSNLDLDKMEPKILLTYLEKDKFSPEQYERQCAFLKKIAHTFEREIQLTLETVATLFTELDLTECICITTSSELAAQMQGLGVAVVGYETDAEEMMRAPYIVLGLDEMRYEDFVRIYQRAHKIPWRVLETERLLIREFCMDDFEDLYRLYEKPHVTDFIEPLFEREQERQYEENYIEKIYGYYGFGMWLLIHKESGKLVGRAGIEYRDFCQEGEVELGYVIDPEYQRMGYATEACRGIMEYAKNELNIRRILCRVDEKNEASRKFLEKLGFVFQEKQEECIYVNDLVDF